MFMFKECQCSRGNHLGAGMQAAVGIVQVMDQISDNYLFAVRHLFNIFFRSIGKENILPHLVGVITSLFFWRESEEQTVITDVSFGFVDESFPYDGVSREFFEGV